MNAPFSRRIPASVALLVIAAPAFAAGEDQGSVMDFNLLQYIAGILVFVVALEVLRRTAWPKITAGLDEREKKILDEISAAEEARSRADAALKDYEASLADARAEADRMIEQTKAEQKRLAAELRAEAEAELEQTRERAVANIEAAKRAALREIFNETASLATGVAAKILEREVNEDDQRRLVEEAVADYTRAHPGA